MFGIEAIQKQRESSLKWYFFNTVILKITLLTILTVN